MAGLVGNPKMNRNARWLLAAFYLLLSLGGLTMVYPFWLMLTGSVSGTFDFKDRTLIPRYLHDRNELFQKFLVQRYNDFKSLRTIYDVQDALRPSDLRGRILAPAPNQAPPPALIADWRQFLQSAADPAWLTVADKERTTFLYREWLEARFSGPAPPEGDDPQWATQSPIERMNRRYRLMEPTFAFISLPEWKPGQDAQGPIHADYLDFLKSLPPGSLMVMDPISATAAGAGDSGSIRRGWADFLRAKYGTDSALAAAWQTPGANLDTVDVPWRAEDAFEFIGSETALRWRMATENYRWVLKFLFQRGRAFQNTLILVVTSIVVALLLNPLAAYAISRYPGRQSRVAMLLMILTIAFPAEVAMIPSFLLLRDFHLLNTFAALILPGAVSGFSVFLLKGFFDGLPEELFESATLDGADEMQVFWSIVLPLSRPILAVIALGTFTAAYGGYMWALLVCQDPEMWTLMVWLFQFQINHAQMPWLGMAAFAVASIPTLLVFLFCQRLILRGIIIPTEK